MPVALEERDKTTFTCHEGTYRYVRLPIGHTNAPATLQRAIHMSLSGVRCKTCVVYLDDVIDLSLTHEENLAHVQDVLDLGSRAGVSLKASKCLLFQDEVVYVGNIVGKGHLRVHDKTLMSIRQAQVPRTKKDLPSFLRMRYVYCCFATDYAKVARPLLSLSSSKIQEPLPTFTPDQMGSFEDLGHRLTHTPTLALPRRTGQCIMETDASAFHVGCVQLQEQDDRSYRPIGYWSRVRTSADRY